MAAHSRKKLVMNFGDSVVFKGELSGAEDLTFCGQMQGNVKTVRPHAHDLAPTPRNHRGYFRQSGRCQWRASSGNVTASEVVEIEATGSVTGDIRAPRLAIADGGYFHGRVEMSLLESHRWLKTAKGLSGALVTSRTSAPTGRRRASGVSRLPNRRLDPVIPEVNAQRESRHRRKRQFTPAERWRPKVCSDS
jgi:hypothetical protein